MAENEGPQTGPSEPSEPTPAAAPAEAAPEHTAVAGPVVPPAPAGPAPPKFTDRVWNFRAMVAVALAALLLGGGVGAAITALSQGEDRDHGPGMMRWQDGPGRGPFLGPGGPNGLSQEQRKKLREDLRNMRKDMRDRLRDDDSPPTPSPTPSPSPSTGSNG